MPIQRAMRHHYGKAWRELGKKIREEAGNHCEWCGRADRVWYWIGEGESGRNVLVVLTVAHLDQDPTNNARENLKLLCQRCHNRHDAPHRKRHAAETVRLRRGLPLPLPEKPA